MLGRYVIAITAAVMLASFGLTAPAQRAPPGAVPAAQIKLRAATFTPALGERPDIPPGLTIAEYASGTSGDYIVQFAGPIDTFDNADAHQQAIQGLSQMKDDVVIHKIWVDGPDVLVWYDLHTNVAEPAPVAEWYRVEDGLVTAIKVVFDARPFAPPA